MADWGSSRAFYESAFWQNLSKRVRTRDNWTCRKCGFHATRSWDRRRLQAHHVISRPHVAVSTPLDCESNLLTVCSTCHEQIHKKPVGTMKAPVRSSYARVARAPMAPRPAGAPRFKSSSSVRKFK